MALTIKQARKVLGKDSRGVSDKEIEANIKIAELLKNLFFETVSNSLKQGSDKNDILNMPKTGSIWKNEQSST